ncbi:hypothetical protein RmaAA213_00830 [Rhodothermus marinus]|uniref:hypothetical protein n=1 Tax=Rhodothermus marinus TaxID=29549 RepID=UPI0012BA4222|nr:hypothetical protein [Rhodothermus marinus]BBM68237.1 hypothetical protein RmaAA213_00830 [Rhodothermus marinus]BBM71211.1 hypothetical protein RmaAA338_00760 [Rhodothermus marinus]
MLVPVDTIHLQEPDTLFLGEFLWVEVELQPFRLYVPDLRLRRVVVYDSLGRPVQVIGRPGTEAPGTLYRAVQVLVHGELVYVQQEYSRVSRFTKTGRFIDRPQLPEGYGLNAGFRSLDEGHLVVPSVAMSEPCSSWLEPACEETRAFSVVDTGLNQVVYRFGVYPQLYQEGNYVPRRAATDVLPEARLAAAVYELSSELQLYFLGEREGRLVRRIVLRHPAWRDPPEDMRAELAVNDRARFNELMLQSSFMKRVFFVADTLVLAHFFNLKPLYFELQGWDDRKVMPYGVLASISGRWQQPLDMPGLVLGRDEAFHLYIRLSDEPDRRLIGRFRVEVRR